MKIRTQVISNIQLILIPVDHITIGISFLFLRDLKERSKPVNILILMVYLKYII